MRKPWTQNALPLQLTDIGWEMDSMFEELGPCFACTRTGIDAVPAVGYSINPEWAGVPLCGDCRAEYDDPESFTRAEQEHEWDIEAEDRVRDRQFLAARIYVKVVREDVGGADPDAICGLIERRLVSAYPDIAVQVTHASRDFLTLHDGFDAPDGYVVHMVDGPDISQEVDSLVDEAFQEALRERK